MSDSDAFLDKDPAELQDFLLAHARNAHAPRGSQQRMLASLASGALGASLALSATEALGAGVARTAPWLIGKWILVGMSASLLTFAAGERVERALSLGHQRAPAVVAAAPRRSPVASSALNAPAAGEPAAVTPPAERTTAAPMLEPVKSSKALASAAPPSVSVEAPVSVAAPEPTAALTREVGMLKAARAALAAGRAATALQALDAYAGEFPAGALAIEAAALRVETVAKLGDRALAKQLGGEFLKRHASSPLAPRVRALTEALP